MTGDTVPEKGGITILGLGNVLMGDDAFGPYVIAALEAHYDFPDGVELIDAGTPGHELSVYLDGRAGLIVIDSVHATGEPGTLRLFSGDEVVRKPPSLVTSPHEPGLRDALLKLAFCGRSPEIMCLVGVIPSRVDLGTGLSAPVLAAVPGAEEAVLRALAEFGIAPKEKKTRIDPAPWWE